MANNSGLSTRALLVSVPISQWIGRKADKKATATVTAHHKTDIASGNYTKKLLPGAKELEKVSAVANKARAYTNENTLPWMADGTRILSAKNYLKFTAEIRKLKAEFEAAVSDFEAAYPQLRLDAQKRLGDLYNEGDYPIYIKDKFSFETNFLPMPDADDFRIEVSEAEKNEIRRNILETESKAMGELWDRLRSVIKTASERLAKPDTIFRDSLLDNITELTAMLPLLNISDDSRIEEVRKEVDALVNSLSPDTLRENKFERQDAALRLHEIEKNLSAYMGVKK